MDFYSVVVTRLNDLVTKEERILTQHTALCQQFESQNDESFSCIECGEGPCICIDIMIQDLIEEREENQ